MQIVLACESERNFGRFKTRGHITERHNAG
jgi:hypothetical protein